MPDRLDELIAQERAKELSKPLYDFEKPPVWDEGGNKCSFHPNQLEAWEATERFVAVVAGARSGKTRAGAHLLLREIARTAVPGEPCYYLIVGPDTKILQPAAIPTFMALVGDAAVFRRQDLTISFTKEGCRRFFGFEGDVRIFIGYASDPDSLQAASYRAVWGDEAGQKDFLKASWEAIQLRTSFHKGRVFLTSTPYTVYGWLRDLVDSEPEREDLKVVRFKTTANPMFPQEEYDRIKREMPPWRAKMYLDGDFSIPEGAIYDCLDEGNEVDDFEIPDSWPRHLAMDFGQVNTAAVCAAESPDGTLYCYADYRTGGRSAQEHAAAISRKGLGSYRNENYSGEPEFATQVGGTWSEDEWRREYINAGLPISRPPIKGLEEGIDCVYRQVKSKKIKFFKEGCKRTLEDLKGYVRELDDRGEPTEKIYRKETRHLCDAVRYLCVLLRPAIKSEWSRIPEKEAVKPRTTDADKYALNKAIVEHENMGRTDSFGMVKAI